MFVCIFYPTGGQASGVFFMKRKLGKFIKTYQVNGVNFYLRGLNVGEYIDLIGKLEGNSVKGDKLVEVAECGIVFWEDFYPKDENGNFIDDEDGGIYELEYSEDNIEYIDYRTMVKVGKIVYEELTMLTEEEKNKFEAFVHFLYWSSEDDSNLDKFNCDTCLESGLAVQRPCGKYDMSYRKKKAGYDVSEESETKEEGKEEEESQGNPLNKYMKKRTSVKDPTENPSKNQKKKNSKRRREKQNQDFGKRYIKIGDYKMKECPVSYIDNWIKTLGEAIYTCEKSDRNFFTGGVSDQRYKIYKASNIVKSTYNKIENKEIEEEKNN